ncbi:MAG: leucine-rich repeat domain-containing protein [Spirochaetota bacterium]
MRSLPESIGQLESLESLDLARNRLVRLPESIGKLKNLKSLNLVGNQLSHLPKSITKLKSLQELDLDQSLSSYADELKKELPECKINFKSKDY